MGIWSKVFCGNSDEDLMAQHQQALAQNDQAMSATVQDGALQQNFSDEAGYYQSAAHIEETRNQLTLRGYRYDGSRWTR